MRDIDHHAQPVHLGDDLLAERRQAMPHPVIGCFAGVRVAQLAVAIVGQRHVAPAPVVELLHAAEIVGDAIAVLDAHERDLPSARVDPARIVRCIGDRDAVRRDLLRERMNGVELGGIRRVGPCESRRVERTLSHVDGKEDRVETARLHLREVDLRTQALCVVELTRLEVRRLDVHVGVEGHHPIVDGASPGRAGKARSGDGAEGKVVGTHAISGA